MMRFAIADPDKALDLIHARLDRSAAAGNDVEADDYPETITEAEAEAVRDQAIADIEDVSSAYGREFVLAVLDRKVIR